MRHAKIGFWTAVALLVAASVPASAQRARPRPLPPGAFGKNVEVIGYSNENGHVPFKLSIQQANGRWYLYTASLYDRGWSILDVTDPADPTVVNWVPGPPNTFTVQVDIADGKMITALERSQFGGDTDHSKPWDDGVMIWSLADPVHPKLLGQWKTGGGLGTHRDGYYGGRYVHLAAGMRGYSGNIYVIVDISDPAHPVEVSRWALPELKLPDPNAQNTAFPHGAGLHGPPVPVGNLVYLPYGKKFVILDISDIKHPKELSEITFNPPFDLGLAVHTVLPFPNRKIVETNSEPFGGCSTQGPSQVSLIDVADPTKPKILSFLPAPQTPPGAPYRDFCEKGGSFGSHNVNMLFHNPFVDHSDNILYLTYFSAGLRIFDISNAYQPREIGYFIPPDPTKPAQGAPPARKLVSTAADVLVDTRGYIYLSDTAQGLWILRYTGPKPGPSIPVH
jgi:hypothetical protein